MTPQAVGNRLPSRQRGAQHRKGRIGVSTLALPLDSTWPWGDAAAPPKQLGAYYTDATVARFLVNWAVVTGRERVLDPGFGGGVFLTTAAKRVKELGGDPYEQVYGIEVSEAAYQALVSRSISELAVAHLQHENLFDVVPSDLPLIDVVVGNPPFIRYQRFNGHLREAALARAREAGVVLSRLASSWAPFLVHAAQFVRPGGRLAMVAPAELAHAAYAKPVLEYLCRSFIDIRIVTFARRLFAKLSEDTVLVLAKGKGKPCSNLELIDLSEGGALAGIAEPSASLPQGIQLGVRAVGQGRERLLHYLIPKRVRDLYRQLRGSAQVASLGHLADVGIGYVTGANDFFHVDQNTAAAYQLPSRFLRPAVRSGADLVGLRFTCEDWQVLWDSGHRNLLLYLPRGERLPESVQAYLDAGVEHGVAARYKCRVREPWYCVPHVYDGDCFVTYMNGSVAKLVANRAAAVAPNTLHLVRLRADSPVGAPALAALWQTTLTALSCELEGHSLGGGMLKLEPTEAGRVLLALPDKAGAQLVALAADLDGLLRAGKLDAARQCADDVILRDGLGLSASDVQALREAWLLLRARRLGR